MGSECPDCYYESQLIHCAAHTQNAQKIPELEIPPQHIESKDWQGKALIDEMRDQTMEAVDKITEHMTHEANEALREAEIKGLKKAANIVSKHLGRNDSIVDHMFVNGIWQEIQAAMKELK